MNIKGLIALPIGFKSETVGIFFFTPGVGATVYFK